MSSSELVNTSTIVQTATSIGQTVEELAKKDRDEFGVKAKANQLLVSLEIALTLTKKSEGELEVLIERHKKNIEKLSTKEASAKKRQTDSRAVSDRLRADSKEIDSKLRALDKEIKNLNKEIEEARKIKNREEDKRKNAALDLIPFYGIIDGLIKGQPERAIPFYSQVDGMISAVEQKVEKAQRRIALKYSEIRNLGKDKETNRQQMNVCSSNIKQQEREQRECSEMLTKLENNIKSDGKLLTIVGNLNKQLRFMDTKTQRMLGEIDLLKVTEEMEAGMFEELMPLNKEIFSLISAITEA
jgi:septal ring factor EnvC (AmiA/AmiB activator)